jgi:Protein of unknown function (DUF3638)
MIFINQVVSPEHRISLLLKYYEMRASEEEESCSIIAEDLRKLLFDFHFIDVFDESDALLHYKYQLMYAVGVTSHLQDLNSRTRIFEALLRVLNNSPDNSTIGHSLNVDGFATKLPQSSNCKYRHIRITSNDATQIHQFNVALVMGLRDSELSNELKWIKDIEDYDVFVSAATDNSRSLSDILAHGKLRIVDVTHISQLLALRGALAHGIFEFALRQRNRVDYGISETRKKSLAVPFKPARNLVIQMLLFCCLFLPTTMKA